MLNIVIAEAALELVPKSLVGHPAVTKNAERRGKKPGDTLLDISLHYEAMKKLPNFEKRGRPDIIHTTLLTILGAPANLEGLVRTYIHTINDYVIYLDPSIKIPRNYNRFVGLMEQLFKEGRVPPRGDLVLMYVKKLSLEGLLKEIKPTKTFFLSENGKRINAQSLAKELCKESRPAVVIGGFQKGEFSKRHLDLADETYAIYSSPLDAWIVASIILDAYGIERGLL
mgnify:CR=1 FL=1